MAVIAQQWNQCLAVCSCTITQLWEAIIPHELSSGFTIYVRNSLIKIQE